MYVRTYVVYVHKPVKVSCLHNVGKGLQSELHINNTAAHLKHVYMRTYVLYIQNICTYVRMYIHTYTCINIVEDNLTWALPIWLKHIQ